MPAPRVFPLHGIPRHSWRTGMRRFGASRSGGTRAHAGVDLYAPVGTPVRAIADGVVRRVAPFYASTYAVEVDHGLSLGVVRYGEVTGALVAGGDTVRAGQTIARVGHLVGIRVPSDMLHLEHYDGTATGPLTVPAARGRIVSGRPTLRRPDLVDPTPVIDALAAQRRAALARPVLRRGAKGDPVGDLQRALRASGEYRGRIDDDLGPRTDTALRAWQTRAGLKADGVAGADTWELLAAHSLL